MNENQQRVRYYDEKINFGLVLNESAGLPMVKIDREGFLRAALSPHFDEDTVCRAISVNPAYAGITTQEIKKIARSCINYETTKVTTLSFAAGIPGGLAMLGSVPADLVQYFGHVLRIAQKLIYLYGWQELFDESGQMDDGTAKASQASSSLFSYPASFEECIAVFTPL